MCIYLAITIDDNIAISSREIVIVNCICNNPLDGDQREYIALLSSVL